MTKRELAFKWITYALCTLLLLFLRALLLGNWRLWGVLPFLPPIILACVVSLEESTPATIFGLVFGVCCDLFFHAPFPCLYTVSFTLAAMTALLLSKSVFQQGFPRVVAIIFSTFFIVDLLSMLALASRSDAAFFPMLFFCVRETLVSCLLLVCYPLFVLIHRFYTI